MTSDFDVDQVSNRDLMLATANQLTDKIGFPLMSGPDTSAAEVFRRLGDCLVSNLAYAACFDAIYERFDSIENEEAQALLVLAALRTAGYLLTGKDLDVI